MTVAWRLSALLEPQGFVEPGGLPRSVAANSHAVEVARWLADLEETQTIVTTRLRGHAEATLEQIDAELDLPRRWWQRMGMPPTTWTGPAWAKYAAGCLHSHRADAYVGVEDLDAEAADQAGVAYFDVEELAERPADVAATLVAGHGEEVSPDGT